MLSLLPRRSRAAERAATVIVAMAVVEMVVIVGQVLRGTTSHFNGTTTLDAMLFSVMGAAITVLFAAQLVLAVVLSRRSLADRAGGYAVRLGLAVSLLGMLVAFPMVASHRRAPAGISGAHSVGVPDGGPGCRCSAGAPPAATCAWGTSSAHAVAGAAAAGDPARPVPRHAAGRADPTRWCSSAGPRTRH
ncbi:hypothetical protein V2I01_36720 [Micromonospora sp. BRA006-A]|nr:hypothetical protein [Micromonospora sp. BRA006-A]